MDAQDRVTLLTRQAGRIVQDQVGRQITLHDPMLIARRERSLLVRCGVTGWQGVASVVLKRHVGDDARGFTEWASLRFLSAMEASTGVAPRFYAGDVEARILVMEDLGGSQSLADVLARGTTTAVVGTLEALAVPMARLVAATGQLEGRFEALRAALPGSGGLGRRHEAQRWLVGREQVVRWADALGIRMPPNFEAACAHIAGVYADPGAYLAFSHGDPAPSNNHVISGRVRLLDFEYGGYRHALYDLTAWDVLCPLSGEWVAALECSFRRTVEASLARRMCMDGAVYREARATMCAYRALAMISWLSADLLVQDSDWAPGWTRREALISTCLRLHLLSDGIAALDPVTYLGGTMAEQLQRRWPSLGDGSLHWPGVTQ